MRSPGSVRVSWRASRFPASPPPRIATLVAYLFSPGAGYLTGQVISVNGGML